MNHRTWIPALFTCLCALPTGGGTSHAAFTFLGPTPYRSAADSPFNLSGLGTTFFLEDFEDNVLTPGTDIGFYDTTITVIGNSVDADDGVLDELDSGGHSVFATAEACFGLNCKVWAQWLFNESAFGSYPTAAGIVVTATSGSKGKIEVSGFGESGYANAVFDIEGIVSDAFDATDDWFIGVTNPYGIYSLTFDQLRRPIAGMMSSTPRFDHLQYGLQVPEPNCFLLAAFAVAWYSGRITC